MAVIDLERVVLDPARASVRIVAEGDARQVAEIGATHGFAVARADLRGCHDAGDARARIAEAVGGRAPDDAAREPGHVLILAHASAWREQDPVGFAAVEAELLAASAAWRERGVPFWVLLPL